MKKLLLTLGSVAAVAAPVAAVVACGGEEDKKVDNSKAAVAGQWTITVGGKVFTITGKADGTSKIGSHTSSEFVTFNPSAPTEAKLDPKTGLPDGYTVSITGTFDKTLKTLDLTNVTLTQAIAPATAGTQTAGKWTANVGGATVAITGKADGTNTENLAAGPHDLTKFLVFTAPAMSPATAIAKSTIPTGFTIEDNGGAVGTTPILKLPKIVEKTAPKEATE